MTKSDCINYDWGDTAPKAYGAFCKVTKTGLQEDTCEKCDRYTSKEPRKELMVCTCGSAKSEVYAEIVGYKITKIFTKCLKCKKECLLANIA